MNKNGVAIVFATPCDTCDVISVLPSQKTARDCDAYRNASGFDSRSESV